MKFIRVIREPSLHPAHCRCSTCFPRSPGQTAAARARWAALAIIAGLWAAILFLIVKGV